MIEPTNSPDSEATTIQLPKGWQYEASVAEVEKLIAQIETGELALEEVFNQFALAVTYLRRCETFLQSHQQQVDLLIETLNDEPEF